jgi:hypothetical protein
VIVLNSEKYLTLNQMRLMVQRKFERPLKWKHLVEERNNLLVTSDLAEMFFLIGVENELESFSIQYDARGDIEGLEYKGDAERFILFWKEDLQISNGEMGISLQGALNGVLVLYSGNADINGDAITWDDLALIGVYPEHDVKLTATGAETDIGGEHIEFYYTSEKEGVKIDGVDYEFMLNLPYKYLSLINDLMIQFHSHRKNTLKLDEYMKPIKK